MKSRQYQLTNQETRNNTVGLIKRKTTKQRRMHGTTQNVKARVTTTAVGAPWNPRTMKLVRRAGRQTWVYKHNLQETAGAPKGSVKAKTKKRRKMQQASRRRNRAA